jgi:predicted MFS family arabinose efflux permease
VLLALTCAVTSSNVYLAQPMLARIGGDLSASASMAGLVSSGTQVGYALGILLLVPLGDIRNRRPLILTLIMATATALTAAALAPNIQCLIVAGFFLGLCTPIPPIVMPLAVMLSGGLSRGRTVGIMQAGLLVGLLASRAYSGALAQWLGWRSVYWCSPALTVATLMLLWRWLPSSPPARGRAMSYPALLRSLFALLRDSRAVCAICLSGALVGVAFGAFWNTLTFELDAKFGLGPSAIGAFGLVAAASALASPLAGRFADAYGAVWIQALLIGSVAAGWLVLAGVPAWIGFAVLGTIVVDIGVWSNQVVNQSVLFALDENSHSRLNTRYFFTRFLGISLGSAVGAFLWLHSGWTAVVVLGLAAALLALPIFLMSAARVRSAP